MRQVVNPDFVVPEIGRGGRQMVGRLDSAIKRGLDILIAGALLVLVSPVIAVLALAIKIDSPGPAFYPCRRVGRQGCVLRMLKFRKMREGASGPALTAPQDQRFTRLGSFLARTK